MQTGTPYTPDDIISLAREAFDASGETQASAADRVGVSQPSVAKALTGQAKMNAVRIRLIEELTGLRATGPFYVFERD